MKRFAALLLCCCLIAPAALSASLTLPNTVTPYKQNELVFSSDQPGTLTVLVSDDTVPLRDAAAGVPVQAGENILMYDALSFNEEPLKKGQVTFTALFTPDDGETQSFSADSRVTVPRSAVQYAVPCKDTLVNGEKNWYLDAKLSAAGQIRWEVRGAEDPEGPILYHDAQKVEYPEKNQKLAWRGQDDHHDYLPAGKYVIRVYSKAAPEYFIDNTVEILAQAPETVPVAVTQDIFLTDFSSDAEVWNALTAPEVIIDAAQGSRAKVYTQPNTNSPVAGKIAGTTAAVRVLELTDRFARIGFYRYADGEYTEGYIQKELLKTVTPSDRCGVVIDKNTQTMTVYERGVKVGVVMVSTGLMTPGNTTAETRAGVYLTADRIEDFPQDGYKYDYPIRIDGGNLIHQLGYRYRNTKADFSEQLALLGTKASHGCVRIDCRLTELSGPVNAYWCWTHFAQKTKFIIIDDTQTRRDRLNEVTAK